ncbi:MAG TPA: phosphatase PAP2 family protein [Planctomycetaceae bacterium]|nr:phosphatase PAP2 family protein [Planctomycetaceae bacterium]
MSDPFTFRGDLDRFLPLLRDDAQGLAHWNNGVLLGAALAGSLAIRDELDEDVRRATFRHPERWGAASNALGRLGEVQYQVPVLLAVYGYSLREQDADLRDLSGSLISAYTLTGLSTTIVKGLSDTDRPSEKWNNGHYGFPSFHVASSMSIAAVLDEYYGPRVGVPAITLAGLIGWSRIDERDHDLSDVVFGAAVGYVIGKSVASRHRTGDGRVHVLPWSHPTEGTTGLRVDVEW